MPVVWIPRGTGEVISSYCIEESASPIEYDIPASIVDPTFGKFTAHTVSKNNKPSVGFVYQRDNVAPNARKLFYCRHDSTPGGGWSKSTTFPEPQPPANSAAFSVFSRLIVQVS